MDGLKVESSRSQSSKAYSAVRSTAAAAKTAKPARAAAKKAVSYVDLLDRSAYTLSMSCYMRCIAAVAWHCSIGLHILTIFLTCYMCKAFGEARCCLYLCTASSCCAQSCSSALTHALLL